MSLNFEEGINRVKCNCVQQKLVNQINKLGAASVAAYYLLTVHLLTC